MSKNHVIGILANYEIVLIVSTSLTYIGLTVKNHNVPLGETAIWAICRF